MIIRTIRLKKEEAHTNLFAASSSFCYMVCKFYYKLWSNRVASKMCPYPKLLLHVLKGHMICKARVFQNLSSTVF